MQSISLRSTEPVICLTHSVTFLKEFAKFSKTAKDRQSIWRAALGKTLPQLSKPLCHNPLPPVRKDRQSSTAAKLRQAAVQSAGGAPWVRERSGVPGRAASAVKTVAKKRSDHVIVLLCAQPGRVTGLLSNRCHVRRDVNF